MPKITINNKEIEFQSGMTVMQACEIAGIEIKTGVWIYADSDGVVISKDNLLK